MMQLTLPFESEWQFWVRYYDRRDDSGPLLMIPKEDWEQMGKPKAVKVTVEASDG